MNHIKIIKEAFTFIKLLEQNNNRDWFNTHKTEFQSINNDIKKTFYRIGELMNHHDEIEQVKVFRIYRDVRFSKNKLPYKTHFSASYQRLKPKLRGGYYVHLQPKNSFIATGFWEPNKQDLMRIRKEFETDASEIRSILSQKDFKNTWGNITGESLKTAPRGFNKNHPDIDLIRRKQFIFIKKYQDKALLSNDFIENVNSSFTKARPYLDLMSDILTTNLNGESLL